MRKTVLAFAFSLACAAGAVARTASAPEDDAPAAQLDTIVVAGTQPGPGLWKVTKGDHALWVLGTLSPLPERMQWRAGEVAQRIGESQEVLALPKVVVDAKTGFFGRLALLPSLIGVRNNPDDAKLADVVPPDQYARWNVLKQKYIGRGNKTEQWRPVFAAYELYKAAIRKNGMTVGASAVTDKVKELAKHAHVKVSEVRKVFEVDKPRDAIREFKQSTLADQECFARTLDRIESDLGLMARRANAWATGDLDALRALSYADQFQTCNEAITAASAAREHGIGDIEAAREALWLDAAKSALERNASTFALLPMQQVVGTDGYLAKLRAQGYAVETPEGTEPSAP